MKKSSLFFLKRLLYPTKTKWLPFLAVHEYVMKYLLIFGTILSKMCQKWRGRVISWQSIRFVERLQNYSTTNNYFDNGWKIEIEFNLGDSKEEFQMKKICIIVPVHRHLNFFDPMYFLINIFVNIDQVYRKSYLIFCLNFCNRQFLIVSSAESLTAQLRSLRVWC